MTMRACVHAAATMGGGQKRSRASEGEGRGIESGAMKDTQCMGAEGLGARVSCTSPFTHPFAARTLRGLIKHRGNEERRGRGWRCVFPRTHLSLSPHTAVRGAGYLI